jgi:hypothetical protein
MADRSRRSKVRVAPPDIVLDQPVAQPLKPLMACDLLMVLQSDTQPS